MLQITRMKDINAISAFQQFYVHCQRDKACLDSLESTNLYCWRYKKDRKDLSMICGECGGQFKPFRALTNHISRQGFKLRRSKIKFYDRDTFDSDAPFQLKDTSSTLIPSLRLPDERRHTASVERKEKAKKATPQIPVRDNITAGLLMKPEHSETKAKTETRECQTKTETETKKPL